MKEIDKTFMNMANEHSDQMTEAEKQAIIDRFYQKSVQDENHSKSQKIAGELYVGKTTKFKNFIRPAILAAAVFATMAGIGLVGNKVETISSYNNQLNHGAKTELNLDQQEIFNREREGILNVVNNAMADLDKINENKEELRQTGNYKPNGDYVDHPQPSTKAEADGLFPLSDLTNDAIAQTVDQTIEEYKSR